MTELVSLNNIIINNQLVNIYNYLNKNQSFKIWVLNLQKAFYSFIFIYLMSWWKVERKERNRKEEIHIQPHRKIDFLQNWSKTLGPIK